MPQNSNAFLKRWADRAGECEDKVTHQKLAAQMRREAQGSRAAGKKRKRVARKKRKLAHARKEVRLEPHLIDVLLERSCA